MIRIRRFFTGDDIFVSYSRADGATYAAGLAAELASRTFSCRLDQWGSVPGSEIPESLKRALRESSVLVLVGTQGAARSIAVEHEVRTFIQTGQPLIPIDFHALRSAPWSSLVEGLPFSVEQDAALESGTPAEQIINRIEKTFVYKRKDERLRAARRVVSGILLILIAATAIAAVAAMLATRRAVSASTEADRQFRAATEATAAAERSGEQAKRSRDNADAARQDAETQQALAEERRAEADRQGRNALSRQLLARAELAKSGNDPFVLPLALGVAAWHAYPSVEATSMLLYGLDTVPQLVAELPHASPVKAVAFTADGAHVSTLGEDHVTRTWNLQTRKVVAIVPRTEQVKLSALSNDGQLVALAVPAATAGATTIVVYQVGGDGAHDIRRFEQPEPLRHLVFSNRSRYLAASDAAGHVTLWEVARSASASGERVTLTHKRTFTPAGPSIEVLQFSPEDSHLLAGAHTTNDDDDSPPAAVWQLDPLMRVATAPGRVFAIDAQARYVAYARQNTWWMARLSDSDVRQGLRGVEPRSVRAVTFLGGTTLVTASDDGRVRFYEIENNGKEIDRIDHFAIVSQVGMDTPGVITVSGQSRLHIWDRSRTAGNRFVEALRIYSGHEISAFSVNPEDQTLAIASRDGSVRLWRKTNYGSAARIEHPELRRHRFSVSGRFAAFASRDSIAVWDVASHRRAGTVMNRSRGDIAAISDDGKRLVTAGGFPREGPVLWDVASGERVLELGPAAASVASSDNGRIVVVSPAADPRLLVWNLEGVPSMREVRYASPVRSVAVSSRGSYLAVTPAGQPTKLIETNRFRAVAEFEGDAFAMDRSEHYVASSSGRNVSLITTAEGKVAATLRHRAPVSRIAISPDGSRIFVRCQDGAATLWTSRGRVVRVFDDAIAGVFSRTGALLFDGTASLIRTVDGSRLFRDRSNQVPDGVAFSPDDRYAAFVAHPSRRGEGPDRVVVVDVNGGTEVAQLAFDDMEDLYFTADGRRLVVVLSSTTYEVPFTGDALVKEARQRLMYPGHSRRLEAGYPFPLYGGRAVVVTK